MNPVEARPVRSDLPGVPTLARAENDSESSLGIGDVREFAAASCARVAETLFGGGVGEAIGAHYQRLERLGSGGMGVVDLAYDERLDRKVAIKRLHRDLVGESQLEALRREARALAVVSHPNVVEIYDVIADGDVLAIVMEYVAGESLAEWSARDEVDAGAVVSAIRQAGAGLAAAHAKAVVHRDFKPSNALVDGSGRVRVCDFGLAMTREAGDDGRDLHWGTPRFMAPEQHAGVSVDERADQFSLCATAWLLLTGRHAFEGHRSQLAAAKAQGPGRWPDDVADVPRSVVRALLRGLHPDPAQRWPSMAALVRALGTTRRGRPLWIMSALAGGLALYTMAPQTSAPAHDAQRPLSPAADTRRLHEARGALSAGLDRIREREGHDARMHFENAFDAAIEAGATGLACEAAAWRALSSEAGDANAATTWSNNARRLLPSETSLRGIVLLAEAMAHVRRGHPADALPLVELAREEIGPTASLPRVTLLSIVAMLRNSLGDNEGALTAAAEARREAVAWLGPEDPLALSTRLIEGKMLTSGGQLERAHAVLTPLLSRTRPDSSLRAATLLACADVNVRLIHFDEAQAQVDEAKQLLSRRFGEHSAESIAALAVHADLATARMDLDGALAGYERLRIAVEEHRGRTRTLAVAHARLASIHNDRGDAAPARAHYHEAITIFDEVGDHNAVASSRANLADLHAQHGELDEARAQLELATPVLTELGDAPGLVTVEATMGVVLLRERDFPESKASFESARRRVEDLYGAGHPLAGMLIGYAAEAASRDGEDATALFERSIELQRKGGAPPEIYAFFQLWYARALWNAGKRRRARALFTEALPHARAHPASATDDLEEIERWLENNDVGIDG